jgi:hypothetical protein
MTDLHLEYDENDRFIWDAIVDDGLGSCRTEKITFDHLLSDGRWSSPGHDHLSQDFI